MKTTKHILLLATLIIVSTLSFTSCDDEKSDTTPPVINLISPANGEQLEIGAGIHFDAEFSDDNMLGSYKVEMHNNFDGHGHGDAHNTVVRSSEDADTTPFAFQQSWDISDKRNATVHHYEIVIPTNATPGNYHFMVYCTDAAGNESYVVRNVVLTTEELGDHDHDHDDHDH